HLDLLAHFKLQFSLLLGIGIAWLMLIRSRHLLRLGLVFLSLNLIEVLPWYLPTALNMSGWSQALLPASVAKPQASFRSEMKVVLANMLFSNQQVEPLRQLIRNSAPDLVVLQEGNAGHLAVMAEFKSKLPYHFRARNLPYGLAVWSRYPISAPQLLLLGEEELPSLSGKLHLGHRVITLFTTHLTSPIRKPSINRNRQLAAVTDYLGSHRDTDLVLGDFNVSMWSPFYRQLERQSGFNNCRKGFGVLPSWPSQLPAWARIPIDQCLTGTGLQVSDFQLGPKLGSDHLPLLITLRV
ncbi:MAG: hypothetical protein CVV27_14080, partial [Candidatus Melainabacteria bacterium HGW-Melainabacteria-1]